MLQPGGVLVHLVLRTPVGDGDHHLWDVSPHPIFHREGLLVRVFQRHACSTTTEKHVRAAGVCRRQLVCCRDDSAGPTCLGVSSLVADVIECRHGDSFVSVCVQLELRLRAVAVLHERHLRGTSEPEHLATQTHGRRLTFDL